MPIKATEKAKTKIFAYDVAEQLRTSKEIAAYLNAWFAEAPDDAAGIARALGNVARARKTFFARLECRGGLFSSGLKG